jgi:hypothetical protein
MQYARGQPGWSSFITRVMNFVRCSVKTKLFVPCLILLLALTGGRAASPAKPASLSTGSATASVRGVVKLQGTVAKGKPISMAADPSCAKLHSAPVLSQDVVADANGGLQNVIIFVADGLADRAYDPPSEPAVIPKSGVNSTLILQIWPKIEHSSTSCLQQLMNFGKRGLIPPVVLAYERDGGFSLPSLGSRVS